MEGLETVADGAGGSGVQPYVGLDLQQVWQRYRSDRKAFKKVPCDTEELGLAPGPSCVGGLVVYKQRKGETRSHHIGAVVQYASLPRGVVGIGVVSNIDGHLVVHPIELPGLGQPSYFLVRKSSMNAP